MLDLRHTSSHQVLLGATATGINPKMKDVAAIPGSDGTKNVIQAMTQIVFLNLQKTLMKGSIAAS